MSRFFFLFLTACSPGQLGEWAELRGGYRAELGDGSRVQVSSDRVEFGAITLRFEAWGRPGEVRALGAAPPRPEVLGPVRLSQRFPGVDLWWQAHTRSLQQGWLLRTPPPGEGPIQLFTSVEGAQIEADGDSATLYGERLVEVGDLRALDARGRSLPVSLFAQGGRLLVQVDDRGARWPIRVDPVYAASDRIVGPSINAGFGASLAKVGDLSGDGIDDLAIGAYRSNKVYVYEGGGAFPPANASFALVESGEFGRSFDGDFDANCDGITDLVVGAPAFNSGRGRVFYYAGSAGGLSTTALSTADGPEPQSYVGHSVAGSADMDGDRCDEIIVGGYGIDSESGGAGVLFGSVLGPSTSVALALYGAESGDMLGVSVAALGDVNGDSYADIGLGACYADGYDGYIKVIYGGEDGAFTETAEISGQSPSELFGCPIAGAGDTNGDGYDDVLVSAAQYSSFTGQVYLFHGGASGIGNTPDLSFAGLSSSESFGGALAPGDVDGDGVPDLAVGALNRAGAGAVDALRGDGNGPNVTDSIELSTGITGGAFGAAVAVAGDLNDDGIDDLVVGAPQENNSTGAVYIHYGYADDDRDGVPSVNDCDDSDPSVSALTISYPDEDVDGFGDDLIFEESCTIRQGWVSAGGDCDDTDRAVHPGAEELPGDEVDQNCDGVELCYVNADGDAYRIDTQIGSANVHCDGAGEAVEAEASGDCDDSNPEIYPRAPETFYDGVDSDCAGDDDFDLDGDGYRIDAGDCDDNDPGIFPGAPEPSMSDVDRNCDGVYGVPKALSGGCSGCGGGGGAAPIGSLLWLALARRQAPSMKRRSPLSA